MESNSELSDRGLGKPDVWSDWLLHRRHADDPAYGRLVQASVKGFADRVLDGARLADGMTLLDIGSGEGLVAFRAIERIGPSLQVILADVSATMLQYAESVSALHGIRSQCSFIECSAERLEGIKDASVDAVASRAVLAYVENKGAALSECLRVLKPGGLLSIAEPLLQDEAYQVRALRNRIEDKSRPADRFLTLLHRWKSAQFPDTQEAAARSPIVNYSERDLLNMVNAAGFTQIHLQLHIDVVPSLITSWDVFLGSSPHPLAPSLKQVLAEHFTVEDAEFLERIVRPTVESGKNVTTDRVIYLEAQKPVR
jgi:ubiquinone/menaquinone biosynthesis C-methylase UbiE